MARKKTEAPNEILPLEAPDFLNMIQNMDMGYDESDVIQSMAAVIEFEKTLLQIAHRMAEQAISISTPDTETERIKAAQRQADLLVQLFGKLQDAAKNVD